MRPWRCDSRLLECLPKFSESHFHVSDPILRVVVCHTPRLASTFRAKFIPSIPCCLCPATPCGMNDSVRTQCLGVTFGGSSRCIDVEVLIAAVSTSRHHAACCCSSLQLTTPLRRLYERWCHVSSNSFGKWSFPVCSKLLLRSVVCGAQSLSAGASRNCDCLSTGTSMHDTVCAQDTAQRTVFKLKPVLA